MFPKSIRWRLQIWLAFLLVCVLSGFGVTVYQLQRIQQFRRIDDELEQRVAALSTALRAPQPFESGPGLSPADGRLGRPPFPEGPKPPRPPDDFLDLPPDLPPPGDLLDTPPPNRPGRMEPRPRAVRISSGLASLFDPGQPNSFYFTFWGRDGAVLKDSTNAPANLPMPSHVEGDTRIYRRTRDTFREAFHFTELGDCVLAGRSITADMKALLRFRWLLLAAGAGVLALGLGGGWWLASRAIRPVEEISAAANRISAGNLSERISEQDPDTELGRLAMVLNSTFTRLEAAFAQQKQFTADASHELRTPIAVLISEAQTALARPRSAPEYRETLEACLSTAQQMRQLTESLLELARFDAGQEAMKREPLDLALKARQCVELVLPLAARRDVQVHTDLKPAPCQGDPQRLAQVVTNLLTNAIQYNRPAGYVRVCTCQDNSMAVLRVEDAGLGISPEDLPHVFERFYRTDKARAHAEGRTGLGLAICKAIAEAHGGALEASSQPGQGSTFVLRLPQSILDS